MIARLDGLLVGAGIQVQIGQGGAFQLAQATDLFGRGDGFTRATPEQPEAVTP